VPQLRLRLNQPLLASLPVCYRCAKQKRYCQNNLRKLTLGSAERMGHARPRVTESNVTFLKGLQLANPSATTRPTQPLRLGISAKSNRDWGQNGKSSENKE